MEGELMPGFLLHLGATVMCAHARNGTSFRMMLKTTVRQGRSQ
jgi:hypothetical protein